MATTQRGSTTTSRVLIGVQASELAIEQRGVISRQQLCDIGLSETTISRMVERRELHRVWPGVYAHGHSVLTREGWLMAASLACGEGSHLSGRASGSARGLMKAWSTIDVATPSQQGVELPGIRAHRIQLRPEERDVHRGLPVTSVARTALDVAAAEGYERTGELLDAALLVGQYDHGEMLELLDRRTGCRGVGILRRAVDALGDEGVVFRSRAERRARDLIREAGLLEPRINAWFPTRAGHGYELDLWWRELRLNFELDGPHHRMPHQRQKDAWRDRDLAAFGVRVVRFPSEDVMENAELLLYTVGRALVAR
ncbi:MAG: DUF559 domain-containing protein [Solirubrobacterales bacterium]|nr:DUF559 domain-containing protein [Solirubrobacterales bacterium]